MQPLSKEELKMQEDDSNLQFIVLMQLIIEKTEFLESQGYIFGSVKSFLVNGKRRFEEHLNNIFKRKSSLGDLDAKEALQATDGVMVLKERVEKALTNEYILTVDQRRERARKVLSAYLVGPMAEKALKDMENLNLFNY